MNKTKINIIKLNLFIFISQLSYWLYIIIVLFLLHNLIDYDSSIILCDTGKDSVDPFRINIIYESDNITCKSNNITPEYNNLNENIDNKSISGSSHSDLYCINVLSKYKNISKRKLYWFFAEKGKTNYSDYDQFKKSWDSNMNIISELKKQITSELSSSSRKLNLSKRSLAWFFKNSKPGGGRGL